MDVEIMPLPKAVKARQFVEINCFSKFKGLLDSFPQITPRLSASLGVAHMSM